jgi:glycosyltransferase involved in cell wall biosynthesis
MSDKRLGLVVTAYQESRKPGLLERALQIARQDSRIQEAVVVVDGSPDQAETLQRLEAFRQDWPAEKRWCVVPLPQNLGVFGAKLSGLRAAVSPWVQSLDSDNEIDERYLDRLFQEDWNTQLVLCPSFARPAFDYSQRGGADVSLLNGERGWKFWDQWGPFGCLLNTGNQCLPREQLVAVCRKYSPTNFQLQQPDYFNVGSQLADRHWRLVYDSADSFFFNKLWLVAGGTLRVVAGLEYNHAVHAHSSWDAAPSEKEVLPAVYTRELADRLMGVEYQYQLLGTKKYAGAKHVVLKRRRAAWTKTHHEKVWVHLHHYRISRIETQR